jgi:hypothetical protein
MTPALLLHTTPVQLLLLLLMLPHLIHQLARHLWKVCPQPLKPGVLLNQDSQRD